MIVQFVVSLLTLSMFIDGPRRSSYLLIETETEEEISSLRMKTHGLNEIVPLLVLAYYGSDDKHELKLTDKLTIGDIEALLKGERVKRKNVDASVKGSWVIVETQDARKEYPKELVQHIYDLFRGERVSVEEVVQRRYEIYERRMSEKSVKKISLEMTDRRDRKGWTRLRWGIPPRDLDLIAVLSLALLNWFIASADPEMLTDDIGKKEEWDRVPKRIRRKLHSRINFMNVIETFQRGIEVKTVPKSEPSG